MTSTLQWFGYVDLEGRLHVKRYFSPRDLEDCIDNGFILYLAGPIEADNRALAIQELSNTILNEIGSNQWR